MMMGSTPQLKAQRVEGMPTKNCNWEFMNCVYMLMYHFLPSSIFEDIDLLPRDLKEESL